MRKLISKYDQLTSNAITYKIWLTMRLTIILLMAFFLNASAAGFSQKVTLNKVNAGLEDILLSIYEQTGFSYSAKNDDLRNARRVTVNVKNEELIQVLDLCFRNQNLTYVIKDKIIIIKEKLVELVPLENDLTASFKINIKGRIKNENGEPAPATISVKGTKYAVNTDANGYFVLQGIEESATLIITGVSIETMEVKVLGSTEFLEITVKNRAVIGEEVVVIGSDGYRVVEPNKDNGSYTIINNYVLNEQRGSNILDRLKEVSSGVLFDYSKRTSINKKLNFNVRGYATINGLQDPLIVVDNFPYEGDISNINPNDVESITILKDAAATSIYGPRGGNGVVVIALKKGKLNQDLKIQITSEVIVSGEPNLSYLNEMTSEDYIDVEQLLFNRGFFNSAINNSSKPPLTPAVEVFLKRKNRLISAADSASQINALKAISTRDEYLKYFYQPGVTQRYGINMSGGGEKMGWLISGSFDKNISNLKAVFDKINLRIDHTYRPIRNLRVDFAAYYTNSKSISGAPAYNSIPIGSRVSVPYLRFADDNGNPLPVANQIRDGYTDTAGAGKLLNWKYYPLEEYKHSKFSNRIDELVANVGLNYILFKGLAVDLKYQHQIQNTTQEFYSDIESFAARNLINQFSQLNRTTGIVRYIVPLGGILDLTTSKLVSKNLRFQLNFNRVFGSHSLSAISGGEVREVTNSNNRGTIYGYNDDPRYSGPVDFVNLYPNFITGSNSSIPGMATSNLMTSRYINIYINSSYTYKEKYIITLSARKDGSNYFGVNTNNKWRPLWSSGLGWNLSKENFKIPWLSECILRLTYGYSGNLDLTRTALPVIGGIGSNPISGLPFGRINDPNNPELRWEKVGQLKIGLDFSLKGQIVSGSIEYYKKSASDLYGPSPYDYTTFGASNLITKNVANMEGKGIDVILNVKVLDKKLKWNTNILFSYNTNKVTKYFGTSSFDITRILGGSGVLITPLIGKPLYAVAAYRWGGLDANGNPQGYINGQLSTNYIGIRDEANLKGTSGNILYIGSTTPRYFGSLINRLSWKRISVAVNLSYRFGYYFKKPTLSYSSLVTNGVGDREYADRWQKPGDEIVTYVPAFVYPVDINRNSFYTSADVHYLKGDHVRLQYIDLKYSFDRTVWRNIPFNELQVYLNASNLGILWRKNKLGFDPEYPSSIPPVKTFTLGVRLGI
jgi:TonB-dependent starch-binding outer membrane protein SusC